MTTKTFNAIWNSTRFECWRVGQQIRYRRPGELACKSLAEAEFKRYFKPIEGESWEPELKAEDLQGGLFS